MAHAALSKTPIQLGSEDDWDTLDQGWDSLDDSPGELRNSYIAPSGSERGSEPEWTHSRLPTSAPVPQAPAVSAPDAAGDEEPTEDIAIRTAHPAANVYESSTALLVYIDAPGVSPDCIQLNYEDTALSYQATRAARAVSPQAGQVVHYQRTFPLARDVDIDGIHATLTDGLLKVRIPKLDPRAKSVPVEGVSERPGDVIQLGDDDIL